jgi:hypothetical protein
MADHFRNGITLKKREGTVIRVGSQDFGLTRLISEKFIAAFQTRTAVFEGQRLLDGVAAIVKLQFECVHLFQVFLSHVLY